MISGIIVLTIFALSIALTIAMVAKKPIIRLRAGKRELIVETFFIGVALGALALILLGAITPVQAILSLKGTSHLSPAGILVLFFSMVFMSVYLDACGFFEYCARIATRYAGESGTKLFFALYFTVSFLTIFTSNDIIILTFTPFIYYFSKEAGIDAKPYLLAEFFAANTWSMMLIVGNPTNILVASAFSIKFLDYLKWMLLPTLAAGALNATTIYLLFKKSIDMKIANVSLMPEAALKDREGATIGVILLALCIITLSIAPYYNFEMWPISLAFAIILGIFIISRQHIQNSWIKNKAKKSRMLQITLKKMPWAIIPFVLSLFIIVEALSSKGLGLAAGEFINQAASGSTTLLVLAYGVLSTLFANILNNIPMTLAFTSLLQAIPSEQMLGPALATIIGSNLGANLTPIGALAGIMWMSILKNYGMKIRFMEFVKYGSIVTAITLAASLLVLVIQLKLG